MHDALAVQALSKTVSSTRAADAKLYLDLIDEKSSFWADRDENDLPATTRDAVKSTRAQIEQLKKEGKDVAYCHGLQEGGCPSSIYEGIHDAKIHIRGRYDRQTTQVPRRFPRFLAGDRADADHAGERSAATGAVDHPPRASADGPRDGEPALAAPLRRRDRPHAQQLRQARRRRRRIPSCWIIWRVEFVAIGLVDQGDAPADHALGGLSAIQRAGPATYSGSRTTCSSAA